MMMFLYFKRFILVVGEKWRNLWDLCWKFEQLLEEVGWGWLWGVLVVLGVEYVWFLFTVHAILLATHFITCLSQHWQSPINQSSYILPNTPILFLTYTFLFAFIFIFIILSNRTLVLLFISITAIFYFNQGLFYRIFIINYIITTNIWSWWTFIRDPLRIYWDFHGLRDRLRSLLWYRVA